MLRSLGGPLELRPKRPKRPAKYLADKQASRRERDSLIQAHKEGPSSGASWRAELPRRAYGGESVVECGGGGGALVEINCQTGAPLPMFTQQARPQWCGRLPFGRAGPFFHVHGRKLIDHEGSSWPPGGRNERPGRPARRTGRATGPPGQLARLGGHLASLVASASWAERLASSAIGGWRAPSLAAPLHYCTTPLHHCSTAPLH